MQFVDVIGSLRRHWRVSVAILLLTVAGIGVFLFTRNETRDPDQWLAGVQLLVPVRDADGIIPDGVPPSLLQGQAQVALSNTTTDAALKAAGLDASAYGDVAFGFEQTIADKTTGARGDIMTLSATAPSQGEAVHLADAYAGAYLSRRRLVVANGDQGERLSSKRGLQVLGKRLDEVESDLRQADPVLLSQLERSDQGDNTASGAPAALSLPASTPLDTVLLAYERHSLLTRILATRQTYADSATRTLVPQEYASVVERTLPRQTTPELPSPLVPVAVTLGIAILLALGVPVLIDYLDKTIRDPRTAGNALSATVLSTIPATSPGRLAALAQPGSARDAAYRALAATSVATDQLPRAIVVTSPVGEMQDSVAANFAAALAGLGLRVALVATDPRQSWFVDSTGTGDAPTLPDMLALARAGRLNGQIRESLIPTHLHNLAILAPGAAGEEAILEGLPALLQALAGADIDVTVIAGPALLEDPSATIFAWSTRSVLWVVESGEVTETEAHEAASRLALAGATAFGVAMVDAKD